MIPRQILDDHPIRVLLIAPDAADRELIARLFSGFHHGSHDLDWVESIDEGRASISAEDHDVYLVHNHLSEHRGIDIVTEAMATGSSAPFIILTEQPDLELEIEALAAGATDHLLTTELSCDSLERSIRHALVHSQSRAELIAARDEAEAATDAKTRFLSNVSHDIRTPLNTIIGMTEIVLRDGLTPDQRECLETVLVAAEALQDLAEQLVDVDKIETGEIELDPAPFSVRDAVADVVRIFGLRAGQKGLRLNVDVPTQFPEMVVADPARLQQVLIDLVSNAVRFTEKGHVDIAVDGPDEIDGRQHFTVSITDTGPGIPADLLPRLFENSAKSTTATVLTGLGVAHRIVNAMGGTLSVESKLGKGSRFAFTVAMEPEKADLAGVDARPTANAGTVLVMSSSPDDRRGIEADLDGAGFDTLVVGDIGAAAQAAADSAARGQQLDAIVLDTAYKPFEVAGSLMQHAGGSTPVTLLVPGGREGDEPRCREAGVKGYVQKSAPPGVLADVVKATIAAARAGGADTLFTPESLGSTRPTMDVLVVDDVQTNLTLTVRMLTERGHNAVAVRSGVEAIDAFEQGRFDAVLMDIQMPGLDGFDTTAAIRAEEVLRGIPRTPIVALTGHTTNEERDRCIAAGMDGFLAKPVRPDALFAAVEQFGQPITAAA